MADEREQPRNNGDGCPGDAVRELIGRYDGWTGGGGGGGGGKEAVCVLTHGGKRKSGGESLSENIESLKHGKQRLTYE